MRLSRGHNGNHKKILRRSRPVFTRMQRPILFRNSATLQAPKSQRPRTATLEILISNRSQNLQQRLQLRLLLLLRRHKKCLTPLPTTQRSQPQQAMRQSTSKPTLSRPIISATLPKILAKSSRVLLMREILQRTPTDRTISIMTSCNRSPIKGQTSGMNSRLRQRNQAASRSR